MLWKKLRQVMALRTFSKCLNLNLVYLFLTLNTFNPTFSTLTWCLVVIFNPFHAAGLFLYPMKPEAVFFFPVGGGGGGGIEKDQRHEMDQQLIACWVKMKT